MARFANTKRSVYTTEKVLKLRKQRELIKPKKDTISQQYLQSSLGRLQAAGHLSIARLDGIKIDSDVSEHGTSKKYNVSFNVFNQPGLEDRPHFSGYLRSASKADKTYQIKGWFNEDGCMRIELVD